MFCTINGHKYRCLFGREYVTFFDVSDKEMFLTVDKGIKLKNLLKNPFFRR